MQADGPNPDAVKKVVGDTNNPEEKEEIDSKK